MFKRSTTLILFASVSTLLIGAYTPASASVSTTTRTSSALRARTNEGVWGTANEIPGTSSLNAGDAAKVDYISCASPGNCGVGGTYTDAAGHQQVWTDDEVAGSWNSAAEIPGMALLNAGTTADVNGISCPTAGNCTAVGDYTDESGALQAFVVDEKGGTWQSAIETPGVGFLNDAGGAATEDVSCASAGNCSAGGFYADDAGHLQSFAISEVNGSWNTATEIPGTAALNVGTAGSLSWISCSSPGNCSADGNYTDAAGHFQTYVVDEQNGTWTTAVETPGSATLNAGGNMFFNGISCSSAGNCSAGGGYTDASAHVQSFTVNEVSGTWGSAAELPGSSTLNAGGTSAIFSLSCTASGSCTGVGNYTDAAMHLQAFVVDEVSGTWGNIQEAPGTATANVGGTANLESVSCTSPGNCDAGGFYFDTANSAQAFLIDEVNGVWSSEQEVPGLAELNAGAAAIVLATSCSTYGNCTAGGFYADGSGNVQAFAISETFTKAVEKIHLSVTQTTKVIKKKLTETGLKITATGLGTASGTVAFTAGKVNLCSATITNGTAKCASSHRFAKGTISVTAKYAGDTYDEASSASSKVAVK